MKLSEVKKQKEIKKFFTHLEDVKKVIESKNVNSVVSFITHDDMIDVLGVDTETDKAKMAGLCLEMAMRYLFDKLNN